MKKNIPLIEFYSSVNILPVDIRSTKFSSKINFHEEAKIYKKIRYFKILNKIIIIKSKILEITNKLLKNIR
jgi:hypothetical protein